MTKYQHHLLNKMDKQVHLSAVKKSIVCINTIVNYWRSFCFNSRAIPNMIETNPISVWILANLDIIYIPYNVGMALMSIYVTAFIAYHLATSYKQDVLRSISMALIAFLMMTVQYTEDGGIDKGFMGPKGLFAAMFASIIAVELFRWCKKKKFD